MIPYMCFFFFFFSSRRRHTRLQGDWSSDVCSSDLSACCSAWRSDASCRSTSRKTMSEPLRGVIVTHAAVAQALLAAVAAITGVSDALVPVSNDGCDSGALTERLMRAIGGRPAVLFVDLPGGPCLTTSGRLADGAPRLGVGAGRHPRLAPRCAVPRQAPPAAPARRAA